jgi:phosphoribosyl-AMP cyclohydrolase
MDLHRVIDRHMRGDHVAFTVSSRYELPELKWNADGLIPAIVQDAETGDVLMMAWMDESALRQTLGTGQTHFYSRSRKSAWHKGGTSGHVQVVESILVDCDADVLLIKVRQVGGACHEGYRSCFFRRLDAEGRLEIIAEPVFEAEKIYGTSPGANPGSSDLSTRGESVR